MTAVFYYQDCPTCGRKLRIRVEYLGKVLVCQHCHASFLATTDGNGSVSREFLLERAERLLESTAEKVCRERPR